MTAAERALVVASAPPAYWPRHLYDVTDIDADALRSVCGVARFNVGSDEPFTGQVDGVCPECLAAALGGGA